MTLAAGARLGPYEIVSPLGAGGMGEVYRARDTRLGRDVAIKVLPSGTETRPELRERFEREARTISSLNHPHICALYDVGAHEGADYLVMELVEGESLAARLQQGPLPASQALRIGAQIADALDKAHRRGVIHRDLKPANVMLTKAGAKLLDFGLARVKQQAADQAGAGLTGMATRHRDLTAEGAIVGTLQYMAPEQLEGKEADARTDIFAFGVTLYEMLTGRRAFDGASQASLIASIMKSEPPPMSEISPMAPADADRLVRICLAKDPDDRWQTAHDLVLELERVSGSGSRQTSGTHAGVGATAPSRSRLPWGLAAATTLLLLAALPFALRGMRGDEVAAVQTPVARFAVAAPAGAMLDSPIALSPDGRMLVFVAARSGRSSLWLRPIESLEARELPGTEFGTLPFWSPDSRSVGFFATGKLKRADIGPGGLTRTICDVADARGGAWNEQGVILFAPNWDQPLHKVSASGGTPQPVTRLDLERKEISHRWPAFLPGGKRFVYMSRTPESDRNGIYSASLDEGASPRLLVAADSAPALSPEGHLLYASGGTLMAQRIRTDSLELIGDPMAVAGSVNPVGEDGPTGYVPVSAAAGGLLAYRMQAHSESLLAWLDRGGRRLSVVGPRGRYSEPALSADGTRLAVNRWMEGSSTEDIWVMDLSRGAFSRLTLDAGTDVTPVWSPDGRWLAYSSSRQRVFDIYLADTTGGSPEILLHSTSTNKWPDHWSADGRSILYEDNNPQTQSDLWVLPMDGHKVAGAPRPFVVEPEEQFHAQFSPDGRYVAYTSNETGRREVYVRRFPGPGGKWQLSNAGGGHATWRADGRELFYVSADLKMMSVEVRTGESFQAFEPKEMFPTRPSETGLTTVRNHYVFAADGQRVLLTELDESIVSAPITLVMNWTAALGR